MKNDRLISKMNLEYKSALKFMPPEKFFPEDDAEKQKRILESIRICRLKKERLHSAQVINKTPKPETASVKD